MHAYSTKAMDARENRASPIDTATIIAVMIQSRNSGIHEKMTTEIEWRQTFVSRAAIPSRDGTMQDTAAVEHPS
jgi:hypothetical protein